MYDSDRIVCRRTEVFGLMTSSARLAMNVTHHFISFCGGITAGAVPHAIFLFVQQQTLALLETHARTTLICGSACWRMPPPPRQHGLQLCITPCHSAGCAEGFFALTAPATTFTRMASGPTRAQPGSATTVSLILADAALLRLAMSVRHKLCHNLCHWTAVSTACMLLIASL